LGIQTQRRHWAYFAHLVDFGLVGQNLKSHKVALQYECGFSLKQSGRSELVPGLSASISASAVNISLAVGVNYRNVL
jgi:hypothetical protein